MGDVRRDVLTYLSRGWAPIPVPFQKKVPVLAAWQNLRIGEQEVDHYWNGKPQNVGILLGAPSRNLVDIDLDCSEAVAIADEFLPPTRSIFGRASAPAAHRLYYCDPLCETAQFADPVKRHDGEKAMIVELRATGVQTVFPPSVHESGEPITWLVDESPTIVEGPALHGAVARLAAAALIARHWPGQGARQYAALALAGGLLRAGWPAEDVAHFIAAVGKAADDEETAKRATAAKYTERRINQEKSATGWPTLASYVGEVVVARATEWLGIRFERNDGVRFRLRKPTSSDGPFVQPPQEDLEPFPLDVFPPPLRAAIESKALSLPCPPDFIAVHVLSVLGTAIGNSRVVEVRPGWRESARLYAAVVADPGSKKSPALEWAIRPVIERQDAFEEEYERLHRIYEVKRGEYEHLLKLWQKDKSLARPDEPEEPIMQDAYITDATLEAVAQILARNRRGCILYRDELTGWVRSMDAYRSGKGGDRQAWLQFWSGAPYKVNRKTDPRPIIIHHPFVNVTGNIPPRMLDELLDEKRREDGFVHRILFTYPEPIAIGIPEHEHDERLDQAYLEIVRRLWTLDLPLDDAGRVQPRIVRLTRAGRHVFEEWLAGHYREMNDPKIADDLRGPWAKLEGYCMRLALILHLTRWADGNAVDETRIDDTSVELACGLVEYFKPHLRRVYRELQATKHDQKLMRAIRWIERNGGRVSAREIIRAGVASVRGREDAARLFHDLEDRGFGTIQQGERDGLVFVMVRAGDADDTPSAPAAAKQADGTSDMSGMSG